MTRRAKRNAGLVTIVAAVVASSLINLASATTARDTADVKDVQLRDLGQKTDECVTSSTSTDTPACAKAAAKAKEVQAQPVVVNVPRRTDAEVKALIEQTIREHPDLVPRGPAGQDYVLTDADKQAIADMVLGKVPVPKNGDKGEPGKDAVVDYDKIVKAVLALIPVPKDGVDGQTPECLSTPQRCVGDTGPEGRGLDPARPPQFVRLEGGQCVLRFFYTKAPDSTDTPAGTFACGA
jgi:hypothetical protein